MVGIVFSDIDNPSSKYAIGLNLSRKFKSTKFRRFKQLINIGRFDKPYTMRDYLNTDTTSMDKSYTKL